MRQMILILFIVTFVINSVIHNIECTPIVITPKEFRVNTPEEIVVISRDNETVTIEISDFSLRSDIIFNGTFQTSHDPLRIPIKISRLLSSEKVTLSVISESGERKESFIKLIPKSGFAFLQTDKPIYTPNEIVRIRMLRVDDNLRPFVENIKIRIKNTQRIIVEETLYTPQGPYYFVDHKFDFPPAPKLGIWSAEVLYGPNFTANYSVTFEVREYVLPTFSVTLKSPRIIYPSLSDVNGSVNVNYVYGKPVEGSVTFKFGVKEPNGKVTYIGRTELKNLNNGSASYHFSTNQFRLFSAATWFPALNGHRFVVEATVHERVTGKRERVTDETSVFAQTPYVISFKNAFDDFKPDIQTFVAGQVLDVFGDPVPDIPVYIHLIDERGISIAPKYVTPFNSSTIETDSMGRVSLPITLKKGTEQLHVTIRTDDPKYTREEQAEGAHVLYAHESDYGFISIANRNKYGTALSIDDIYQSSLIIRGDILYDKIYLIIVNRGRIISSEKIPADGNIKINITENMTPNIRVIVLALTRENGYVLDSLKIDIQKNKCGFELFAKNSESLRPGAVASLIINGTVGDSVALLGVDEAVYVLRNKDKLTKTRVESEIAKTDIGCGSGGGRNALDVVGNAGLKLISWDSKIYEESNDGFSSCQRTVRVKRETADILKHYTDPRLRKCCILGATPSNRKFNCKHKQNILKYHLPAETECHEVFLKCCESNKPNVQQSVAHFDPNRNRIGQGTEEYVHIAYENDLEDKTLIRKDFRETWLFDIVLVNQSSFEYNMSLPHSITTWSVTGMSLSPKNGLCIDDSPTRIVSFQPIFLQIGMPYSVVQNEQIEVLVTVFNYGKTRVNVSVYTYGMENICSGVEPGDKSRKHIRVEGNSAQTVAFPMVPLRAGKYDLKFVALWSSRTRDANDVVVKTLNVVPPGVPVEDDFTFQLDPLNRQRRKKRSLVTNRLTDDIDPENARQSTTINLSASRNPEMIVPYTQECILSAIADQFGATAHTTLNDIDQLIRQPKGCGEQTMLFLAPTLYTIKYLESIQRLNGDLSHRGKKYLKDGYKRELSFRKDDGSFSAFPVRPSSVWLTAFVMRVFCQSAPYIIEDGFDQNVIYTGLNYLLDHQKNDGSWSELHPVVHEKALGGVQGSVPLTAYVHISFSECIKILRFDDQFKLAVNKSESFLIKNQKSIVERKDTYAMGLIAYSLTFRNPRNSHYLINALHNLSNSDNARNHMYWRNTHEVEATSYALLAILNSGIRNSIDALSIANWLNSRRSFTGSFDTTQDTIVALEALSQFAKSQTAIPHDVKLNCNITSSNKLFKRSISFHKDNSMILQMFKVDPSDKLEFNTEGNGIGLMSVKLKYNIHDSAETLCNFDAEIRIAEWKDSRRDESPDITEDDFSNDFNDFPSNLINELDLKTKRKKRSLFNGGGSLRQSFDRVRNRLQMTSFGIRNMSRAIFGPYREYPNASVRNQKSQKRDALKKGELFLSGFDFDEKINYETNNLSNNKIPGTGISRLILVLDICVRHIPRYNPEMSIIEFGILSGYVVNKDDLEEILKKPDTLVSKYELSDRNIIFYLDTVPYGRPFCMKFRIIREYVVSNTQAAVVKVYDYYKPDRGCSQLYTPTQIGDSVEVRCNSSVCECAKRRNCPNSRSLIEISTVYERKIQRARDLFIQLVCNPKYHYVYSGKFIEKNKTRSGFTSLRFRIDRSLKGDEVTGEIVWMSLRSECDDTPIELAKDVLIFGQMSDSKRHLNGTSILHYVNEYSREDIDKRIYYLRVHLEDKIRKDYWKCAQ